MKLSLVSLTFSLLVAQTTTTNSTSGPCALIAPNNKGQISITDCGNRALSKSDRKLIQDLLPQFNRQITKQAAALRKEILSDLNTNSFSLLSEMQKMIAGLRLQEQPTGPTFSEDATEAEFEFGSNRASYPINFLRQSKIMLFNGAGVAPTLYVEGDRLFVDTDLWTPNGTVVHLLHNRISNRPPDWDLNSNNVALEVVDSNSRPVFQLIYKSNYIVQIKGRFQDSVGSVLFISDGHFMGENPIAAKSYPFHLDPIFKHPAWKYPGELVK